MLLNLLECSDCIMVNPVSIVDILAEIFFVAELLRADDDSRCQLEEVATESELV